MNHFRLVFLDLLVRVVTCNKPSLEWEDWREPPCFSSSFIDFHCLIKRFRITDVLYAFLIGRGAHAVNET